MTPAVVPLSAPFWTSSLQAGHEGRWLPDILSAPYASPGCPLMDLHLGSQTDPRMLGTHTSRGHASPAAQCKHHFLGNLVSCPLGG